MVIKPASPSTTSALNMICSIPQARHFSSCWYEWESAYCIAEIILLQFQMLIDYEEVLGTLTSNTEAPGRDKLGVHQHIHSHTRTHTDMEALELRFWNSTNIWIHTARSVDMPSSHTRTTTDNIIKHWRLHTGITVWKIMNHTALTLKSDVFVTSLAFSTKETKNKSEKNTHTFRA